MLNAKTMPVLLLLSGSALAALATGGTVGCGEKETWTEITWPDPGQAVQQDLVIEPSNGVFVVDTSSGQPAMYDYDVTNKAGKDVAATVAMSAKESPFGAFNGAAFTSTRRRPKNLDLIGTTSMINANLPTGENGYAWSTLIFKSSAGDQTAAYVVGEDGKLNLTKDQLQMHARMRVDLAVVMDSTGSMGGAIENLKANLQTKLFPALKARIPNAGIAVVDHKDYPVDIYGASSDFPVAVYQTVTTDVVRAQAAVEQLSASGGSDLPESQIPAMFHVLTGAQLTWPGGMVAEHVGPEGTYGGVDFRRGSLPIVALITDVDWHDTNNDPYEGFEAPDLEQLKVAFGETKALFVNLTAGDETQANELSDATGSAVPRAAFGDKCGGQCCTGVNGVGRGANGPNGTCRLTFLHERGEGVSDTLITAVTSIMMGKIFDVTLEIRSDSSNPPGIDVTKIFAKRRAVDEGNAARGCAAHPAVDSNGDGVKDKFVGVPFDTALCYEIELPETVGMERKVGETQFLTAHLSLVGQPGDVVMEERTVVIVAPPKNLTAK